MITKAELFMPQGLGHCYSKCGLAIGSIGVTWSFLETDN